MCIKLEAINGKVPLQVVVGYKTCGNVLWGVPELKISGVIGAIKMPLRAVPEV